MNFKQQTFVTEYLRHNSAYTAYCLAYNPKDAGNYDSIMSAANRLLNHPEVSAVIDSILSGIRHDVEQELRAKLKTDLLTTQRKREILAKIATGEMYAVQVYKGKDCNQCTQHVMPTINQMLKAIDLDNRMVGLYAPAHAHHKPQTVPALNTDVLQQVDKFLKSLGLAPEQIGKNGERQQNTTTGEQVPLFTKEGTMTNSEACLSLGEVDSCREETPTTEAPAPTPEKTVEIPTKDNKNAADANQSNVEQEASSLEGGVADAIGDGGCPLATDKSNENQQPGEDSLQQSTTFVSPGGLINIRTNRDSDAQGGATT